MRAAVQAAKMTVSPQPAKLVRGPLDERGREPTQRLPVRQCQCPGVVQFVFGLLVVPLPAGHPGGVAVDDPVADSLFHDPDQNGEAVFHGGPAALVGDPPVHRPVDGTVGDHPHGQVPERWDDALAPPGEVGVEGLGFQAAQRQRHHGVAV